MLFCKNLVGTRSRRRGGTSTVMSDKSTSSKTPAITATETPQPSSPPRKIYPIVKYGDPVLERPGAPVQKFDAELEDLAEDCLPPCMPRRALAWPPHKLAKAYVSRWWT